MCSVSMSLQAGCASIYVAYGKVKVCIAVHPKKGILDTTTMLLDKRRPCNLIRLYPGSTITFPAS